MRVTRSFKSSLLLATTMGVALFAANGNADEAAAKPVKAVWQLHDVHLAYFGLTTYYTCDSLIEKTKGFLLQAGARDDIVVSPAGCTEINAPEKIPGVRVVVALPVEATDANIQAIANDPKRAALSERLQRKSKKPVAVGNEPFDATWQQVTLNTKEKPSSYVGASGDCELLDQMRRTIFPELGIKVVDNGVSCTPYQGTPSNQRMKLEVLSAAPTKS